VWFTAGLILLGWVCLHEAFLMLKAGHPYGLAGFIGLAGMLVAARQGGPDAGARGFRRDDPARLRDRARAGARGRARLAVTVFGLAWIALAAGPTPLLLRDTVHGGGCVAAVLAGTFAGRQPGALLHRPRDRAQGPLAPGISPNKTVRGPARGAVASILGVEAVGLYQDWFSGWDALALSARRSPSRPPLGDLFESYFKRDRRREGRRAALRRARAARWTASTPFSSPRWRATTSWLALS